MLDQLTVEVYNASGMALDERPWREAVQLLFRQAATPVKHHDPAVLIRSQYLTMRLPSAVMLIDYAPVPYRRPTPTRERILRRDGRMCGYCGGTADTIDHILPRSKGGGDTWINLVACCVPCNGHKADRLPEQAGMRLIREPWEPKGKEKFLFLGTD